MTLRACLRLLLLAAMLLAPLGRIAISQAMAAPAGAQMAGHCAGMPAAAPSHHQGGHHQKAPARNGEGVAVDCMIACAAMATAPEPFIPPAPVQVAQVGATILSSLTGIQPEADPPPPRFS